MSEHVIEVVAEFGELSLKFRCNAVPGSPCKRRPVDSELEEWPSDYQGEMVDADCWAAEWVSECGWESIMPNNDSVYASIPISISYDDGVIVTQLESQTSLGIDWPVT